MNEKKPKQNWPQTPLQWLGVLILFFLAYSAWEAVGNVFADPFPELTASQRKADESFRKLQEAREKLNASEAKEETPQESIEPNELIVGRWQYWGTLADGKDETLGFVWEFFPDGTYAQVGDFEGDNTNTGFYEVIGNDISTTAEKCENGECRTETHTKIVRFPDANTMHFDNEGLVFVFYRE